MTSPRGRKGWRRIRPICQVEQRRRRRSRGFDSHGFPSERPSPAIGVSSATTTTLLPQYPARPPCSLPASRDQAKAERRSPSQATGKTRHHRLQLLHPNLRSRRRRTRSLLRRSRSNTQERQELLQVLDITKHWATTARDREIWKEVVICAK